MANNPQQSANIVVMIALSEEHDRFKAKYPPIQDLSSGTLVRIRHQCDIPNLNIISVLANEQGADHSTSAAYSACNDLNPDLIVCIGIAGTLTDDLNLGDVAISSEIIDILHSAKISDVGKRGGSRPELSPRNFGVNTALQASCRFFRSHPDHELPLHEWISSCKDRLDRLSNTIGDLQFVPGFFPDTQPMFLVGPIVCGPVVVSKALSKQIKEINRKTLAVETESGGIFRVAQDNSVPAITIRGISDRADPDKKRLESTTKNAIRQLAMDNAIALFTRLINIPSFTAVAFEHAGERENGSLQTKGGPGPQEIIKLVEDQIISVLEELSPNYKNRQNNAPLPLPRIQKLIMEDDFATGDEHPISIYDAISQDRAIFLKVARSYPDRALAWSIAQQLLKYDINGKQLLPIVIEGSKVSPPTLGLSRLSDLDLDSPVVLNNFYPIVLINEPDFQSRTKLRFLSAELRGLSADGGIVVLSKCESPIEAIDSLKADLGLTEYLSSSVPFCEIAAYLERAFEMTSGEADAVAARLDDTFTRFRLNTHPSYFIGLEETTLNALIEANQRAELIELAVAGLLSFTVASDKSTVKLTRSTREEFLRELAFEIRVQKRKLSLDELILYSRQFAKRKALEIEPMAFIQAFFDIGILNDIDGRINFSLPFVEAFLLSDKFRSDPKSALQHFDFNATEFDIYTFDLYCERGASEEVVAAALDFAFATLTECGNEENVFSKRSVNPAALSTPANMVNLVRKISNAVDKIASTPHSDQVRLEKQQLIDARQAVRQRVGDRSALDRSNLSSEKKREFERLDRLSRSTLVLATLVGSGAERLDGEVKIRSASLLMSLSERFCHYWTLNRLEIDFSSLRKELLSDESVKSIIEQFELFGDDQERVRSSLALFLMDQELTSLSTPIATVLYRLANYAGVRTLKPVIDSIRPANEIEALLRAAWYMDVEAISGRRAMKSALSNYKGSDLIRFVLANHLTWRVFWHHWQHDSKRAFVQVSKRILLGLGFVTGGGGSSRSLSHEAD